MKTLCSAICAVALILGLVIGAIAPASAANIEAISKDSTVYIMGEHGKNAQGQTLYASCSGVIVKVDGDGLEVLTAAHCIALNTNVHVFTANHMDMSEGLNIMKVTPVPGHDLAIVKTAMPNGAFDAATLSTALPAVGDALSVIGAPYGKPFTISPATGATFEFPPQATGRVAIQCKDCYEGDSGGGVFNANGNLVGILTSAWSDKNENVLAVEIEPLAPALALLNLPTVQTAAVTQK